MPDDMPKHRIGAKAFLRRAGDFLGSLRPLISGARAGEAARMTAGTALLACMHAPKQAGARHVDVILLACVVRGTDVTI